MMTQPYEPADVGGLITSGSAAVTLGTGDKGVAALGLKSVCLQLGKGACLGKVQKLGGRKSETNIIK